MKKAPRINIQAPEKFQAPNIKHRLAFFLQLEAWCFSEAWNLNVGAFHFSTSHITA
jgi:hypothetical protein